MSRDTACRIAALELKLRPAEPEAPLVWDPWQEILSADEDALLWRLAANRERFALAWAPPSAITPCCSTTTRI